MTDKKDVVASKDQLPAFLQDRMVQDAGRGLSSNAEDNLVPMVYVLQTNSPQVSKRDPQYVEGAEAGDIWLRNSPVPPIKGTDGMVFQPAYFSKDWVEWKPNRGGYVGRHLDRPTDAVEKNIDPQNPDRKAWVRPNGNLVVETRYHVGHVHVDHMRLPYVIPMSGTGHTVSKGWMARMNAKSQPGLDGPVPSWACLYRLTTQLTSNTYGSWLKYIVEDEGWVQDLADYERGSALNAAFSSGEKTMEAPQDEAGDHGSSGTGKGGM